jgi:protein DGCR14
MWEYKSKNSLMYYPEGVPLSLQEQLAKSQEKTNKIKHSNTRLSKDVINSLQRTTTTPKTIDSQLTSHIQVIPKVNIEGKDIIDSNTPNVRGYNFVNASPSPMPGRLAGDESPQMMWGEIESTPFRLDGPPMTPLYSTSSGNVPEFRIPDVPEREKLAFDLEEKASAARRKKKQEALEYVQRQRRLTSPKTSSSIDSPSSSSSTISLQNKINNMSPAAQRLLSSKLNLKQNVSTPSPVRGSATSTNTFTPSPFRVNRTPSASNSTNSPIIRKKQ